MNIGVSAGRRASLDEVLHDLMIGRSMSPTAVQVRSPARLHLGFLDPGAHLGRSFGSLGATLDGIVTRVRISEAGTLKISGRPAEPVRAILERLHAALGLPLRGHVEIRESIRPHAGLGSGTQLALAVGMAFCHFHGYPATVRQVAGITGRGRRSGIGIAAFEKGGFLVDGGRGSETSTPPLIAHLPMPASWRWLLIQDAEAEGLSGSRERAAFERLPRFPRAVAADLCYRLMIQGLPALAEGDYAAFCEVLAAIQQANGEYFAPAQGGRYSSHRVAEALTWLQRRGWVGLGQSSWGPTGFCLLPDPEAAERELDALGSAFAATGLRFQVVATRNRGADLFRE
ncbi:MAG TPA: GHMP kinase [Methylothermaceae bacterium]|nr:GHMP kinase [Methylothermaceae bacterium]